MSVQSSIKRAHYSSVSISLVINGLLVVALLTFITFQDQSQRETSTVMVIDPAEQELIEEIEEEIVPEEVVDPDEITEDLTFDMDMQLDTEFEPETEVVETTATEVSALTDLMSDVSSPVVMTGMMVGRTPSSRAAAIKRYGQGVGGVSEASVLKALEWLRDNQNTDGSWSINGGANGRNQNVGYVGLGLLTFLAHGETPSSAEFGPTVAKAIRYLVENQNDNGSWGKLSGKHTSYGHAMGTYALAEAYTMTENPLLREPLEKAVKVIMDGQMANGGYDYDYKNENRNDLSVAAWNLQAMKAATISGVGGEELKRKLQSGMDGMLGATAPQDDGTLGFPYMSKGGAVKKAQNIVSPAGTLCLFLTGRGRSSQARSAINYLEANHLTDARIPAWGTSSPNKAINEWYYTVQAIFQDDPEGANFKKYYPAMVKELAKNQASDGHWLCYTDKGSNLGKTFNTTLGALGLMVTYRYLPTTQADNIRAITPSASPAATEEAEEDIGFEI